MLSCSNVHKSILSLEFSSKSSIPVPMNSLIEFLNVRNMEKLCQNQGNDEANIYVT